MKRFLGIYIGTEAALERAQWNKLDQGTDNPLSVVTTCFIAGTRFPSDSCSAIG